MSDFGKGSSKQESNQNFTKYVGFFKGSVVAVNPTREELNELQGREGKEDDKELEYTGEKDGKRTAKVTFWIDTDSKDSEGKPILIPYTIMLKDEVRRNNAKDKIQIISQTGDDQYVEADEDNQFDESKLFDSIKSFTKIGKWKTLAGKIVDKYENGARPSEEHIEVLGAKKYRPALQGEAELVKFVKVWLSGMDYTEKPLTRGDEPANLLLDTEELFDGDFSQLDLVKSDFANRSYQGNSVPIGFVPLAYVKVDEDDPEKQYQRIFREFLPAKFIKFIQNDNKMPDKYALKTWEKFIKEVEGDYGIDGAYVLEPLQEYNPDNDYATSTKTRQDVNPADSSY